jgi:hypothetical protein
MPSGGPATPPIGKTEGNVHLEDMRGRLDAVSPYFCLAKWYQVTMHLQNGHTHSCHHPGTHLVPVEELSRSPSALHNTHFKKLRRREMLTGARPAECDYCWKVEEASRDNISDRIVKSSDAWAEPSFDAARTMAWNDDVVPTYVEVSFSNVCNFKCSYCSPWASSKWSEEVKQHGPYPTSGRFNNLEHLLAKNQMPIAERDNNPYVDAFWAWWPELYPKLKVFRITGGEPLLSKHTMRVLAWILEHPHPDLQLSVNSNLGVPEPLYAEFLDMVGKIVERGCVKTFEFYTSVDAYGHRAEYIRNGLDYRKWLSNVRRFFEVVPNQHLVVMCAFNALSVTSFLRLYGDLLELRRANPDSRPGASPGGRIRLDLPYLRHPEHQSVIILPPAYGERMDDIIAEVQAEPEALKMEIVQLARIRSLMRTPWPEPKLGVARTDFFRFFAEHDRRRGTNFLATFPEMTGFWRMCSELAS